VENYPGFADVIQGPWLMDQMRAQAEHVGTEIVTDHIVAADVTQRPFRLTGDSGAIYTCDVLIIATGAQASWLGLPSEETFKGFGVSACATCDGFFFRDRKVVVVGGGNTAVEEALFLTRFASEVLVVHRRDAFRAEKILQQRLFENPKVTVRWNAVLEEVLGTREPPGVTGARLRDVVTGAVETVDCDGIFIAIGHKPATELFQGQLAMRRGYIVTAPDSTATDIPGVYAAGDVTDDIFRQAVTAAGLGSMAALAAEKYLAGHASLSAAAE
jgi:thioredoxin reductase (NADPH)